MGNMELVEGSAGATLDKIGQRRAERDAKLDESGIGHDVEERLNAALKEISVFCAGVQRDITAQAAYNLLTNVPLGILSPVNVTAHLAIRQALAGVCGKFVHYDIDLALDLAADILDDVNAHTEAAQVRAMKQEGD